jgi:hypothetical protein
MYKITAPKVWSSLKTNLEAKFKRKLTIDSAGQEFLTLVLLWAAINLNHLLEIISISGNRSHN